MIDVEVVWFFVGMLAAGCVWCIVALGDSQSRFWAGVDAIALGEDPAGDSGP